MVAKNKEKEEVADKEELKGGSLKSIFTGVFQGLSFFDKLSFSFLFLLVFLLPIFSLEFLGINLDSSKLLSFSILVTVIIVSFIFARLKDKKLFFPQKNVFLIFSLFVLVSFISALFSSSYVSSFLGYGFEFGTVVSFFYAFFLLLISSYYIRSIQSILFLLVGASFSFLLVVLFSLVKIFLPINYIMGVALGDNTMSLVGSWGDFGIYVSIMSLIFVGILDLFKLNKFFRVSLIGLFFLGILSLIFSSSVFPWIFFGSGALIIFVSKLMLVEDNKKSLPIASFISIVISLLFIFSSMSSYVSEKWNIQYREVRPNLTSSLNVVRNTFFEEPFTGFGPNNFAIGWNKLRSQKVLDTDFWDTSFPLGIGYIPTFFVTLGYLGGVLFLLFLLFLLFIFIRKTVKSYGLNARFYWLLILLVINFVLFLYYFLAIGGLVIFLYSFIIFGLSLSFISYNTKIEKNFVNLKSNLNNYIFISSSIIFLILSPVVLERAIVRVISVYSFDQSQKVIVSSKENLFLKESYLKKSYDIFPNDLYARSLSTILYQKLSIFLGDSSMVIDSVKPELQNLVSDVEEYALLASSFNRKDSTNWQFLGEMYYKLYSLGINNTFDSSLNTFNKVKEFNPLSPLPDFYIGQLYIGEKKYNEAEEYFKKSLAKKADYEDATLALINLYHRNNRSDEAINYAKSIENLFSNNYNFFLNVGIVKYEMGQYKEALIDLSRSMILKDDNENTRYYMALTYSSLGRIDESLFILKELLKKYPDSENIKDEIYKIENRDNNISEDN